MLKTSLYQLIEEREELTVALQEAEETETEYDNILKTKKQELAQKNTTLHDCVFKVADLSNVANINRDDIPKLKDQEEKDLNAQNKFLIEILQARKEQAINIKTKTKTVNTKILKAFFQSSKEFLTPNASLELEKIIDKISSNSDLHEPKPPSLDQIETLINNPKNYQKKVPLLELIKSGKIVIKNAEQDNFIVTFVTSNKITELKTEIEAAQRQLNTSKTNKTNIENQLETNTTQITTAKTNLKQFEIFYDLRQIYNNSKNENHENNFIEKVTDYQNTITNSNVEDSNVDDLQIQKLFKAFQKLETKEVLNSITAENFNIRPWGEAFTHILNYITNLSIFRNESDRKISAKESRNTFRTFGETLHKASEKKPLMNI